MGNKMLKTFCGLHGANIEKSVYNNDGQCKCLGYSGNWCQHCESLKNNEVRLERCTGCLKQR